MKRCVDIITSCVDIMNRCVTLRTSCVALKNHKFRFLKEKRLSLGRIKTSIIILSLKILLILHKLKSDCCQTYINTLRWIGLVLSELWGCS